MKNQRAIVLFVILATSGINLNAENSSPSRHEAVQLSWVKMTADRSGNATMMCIFTNTTDQAIVFYPELYDQHFEYLDLMDKHQCLIKHYGPSRGRRYGGVNRNFDLSDRHSIHLQGWGSAQYTDVRAVAVKSPEGFENVETMTVKVHFYGHKIKDLFNVPPGIYTNDISGKLKMAVTIDGDKISVEPALKNVDEQGR